MEEGREGPAYGLGPAGARLVLMQEDVRELQLAKAAVRAGIEARLRVTGTAAEEIERIYLAGSFGMTLDPESAMAAGIFPRLPP